MVNLLKMIAKDKFLIKIVQNSYLTEKVLKSTLKFHLRTFYFSNFFMEGHAPRPPGMIVLYTITSSFTLFV